MKGLIVDKTRIIHILEEVTEIEKYIAAVSYDEFLGNSEKRFATVKQIEIVGGAVIDLLWC